jgi:hypothetical protein
MWPIEPQGASLRRSIVVIIEYKIIAEIADRFGALDCSRVNYKRLEFNYRSVHFF